MASEVQNIGSEKSEVGARLFRIIPAVAGPLPRRSLAGLASSLPILLNQLFNSAANFVATVLLLRLLGLAEFGHYTLYYLVALAVISVLGAMVTSPAVSIAATLGPERRRQVLTAAGTMIAIGVAGVVLLLLCVEWLFGGGRGLHLLPFAAMFAAIALSEQARRYLLFSRTLAVVWYFDLLRFGLLIGILAFAIGPERDASFAMLAVAAAFAPALVLAALFLVPRRGTLSLVGFQAHAGRLLTTGRWLSMSAALEFINNNTFLFVGFVVLGNEAVGIVRACGAVIGLVNPFILALEHILPRYIGQLVALHGWLPGIRRYFGTALRIGAALLAFLAILAALAEPLLGILAGSVVSQYAWVLQGLVLAWVSYLAFYLLTYPLRALERTGAVAVGLAASTVLALIIAFPLVAGLGLAGIVAGTVVTPLLGASLLAAKYVQLNREAAPR